MTNLASCYILGNELQRPMTSYNLPELGVNSVGHMTTLQGTKKWVGLGKHGERFVTNVFNMVQPVLPLHHRAALSLSWMQYEKLKVRIGLFIKKKKEFRSTYFQVRNVLNLGTNIFVFLHQVVRCLCSGNKKRLRPQGKSSKRVAKRLLKEPDNRSSLVLWREYAHLEWMLGNLEEARKVFSTATEIGGSKGLSSPTLCELCLLWSQLEVEDQAGVQGGGQTDATMSPAVLVLTRLAEGTSSSSSSSAHSLSPVAVLKARRSYEQALTASLSALDQVHNNPQTLNAKGTFSH